jgi:hypothetical protein
MAGRLAGGKLMALRLQRRSAFGWPATAAPSARTDHGMAVHYEGGRTGIANWTHDRCIAHWQATRRFHMNTRGWIDIGYAYGLCKHYVLEGRGGFRAQAAQPGGNTTWESATFMTGPGEAIHPGQLENFRQLRAWRRSKGVAAAIRPHSSFVSTGCPGDILRRMIADGTLTRPPQPPEGGLERMMFCKLGDKGDAVGALQLKLRALGLYNGDIDKTYGSATSAAVLKARQRVGSTAESGDTFGYYAYWQVEQQVIALVAQVPKLEQTFDRTVKQNGRIQTLERMHYEPGTDNAAPHPATPPVVEVEV